MRTDGRQPHTPLRLLYIRDTLTICGPGKTILNTSRTLDRNRFAVTLVATQPAPDARNDLVDAVVHHGTPAITMRIGRGLDLVAIWRLVRLIRTHKIDILQSHDAQTRRISVIAAALTSTTHVSSVHGWIFNSRKELIARWLDRRLLRMADAVITVSDRLRRDLISDGVPAGRITLLRNAIMLEDYQRRATSSGIRSEFGIPEGTPVVSIVGRLSAEKGHGDFLTAARLVLDRIPSARFLIIGDGPERAAIERQIEELRLNDRVIMTGHRNDLAELYALTDVLALSSYTEGIPNVVLEAFAYGKPAVATSVGGVPEVLEDGKTGYLIQPREPDVLANRLIALLEDAKLRETMGQAARRMLEERFSFRNRTHALEALYERLAGTRHGASPDRVRQTI